MKSFQFLTTQSLDLNAVWAWAKRLVQDLNEIVKTIDNVSVPSGSVQTFAGPRAPVGWLICDGGLYSKFDYPNLFNAIGFTYGGGGSDFNVPDFRDRFLMGAGGILPLGTAGGATTVTLASENMPVAGAALPSKSLDTLDLIDLEGTKMLPLTAQTNVDTDNNVFVDLGGSSTPVDILPPAMGINIIIKV